MSAMSGISVSSIFDRYNIQACNGLLPVYIVLLVICVILFLEFVFFPGNKLQTDKGDFSLDLPLNVVYDIYSSRIQSIINSEKSGREKKLCQVVPVGIQSRVNYRVNETKVSSLHELASLHPDVSKGGAWEPRDCKSRRDLAIVIPYRDRKEHLLKTLSHLIPVLKLQEIKFRIYLAEQNGSLTFNKGILMNAAYLEALKDKSWKCFVFHDVDIIPENFRTLYACSRWPRHLSVAIDEFDYLLPYEQLVGGVFVIRREHYLRVNGYSNMYWGWGSEDDDMAKRIYSARLRIDRPPYNYARFKQYVHEKRNPSAWKIRYAQLYQAELRQHHDGVKNVQYRLLSKVERPLFTHLLVDVGKPPL